MDHEPIRSRMLLTGTHIKCFPRAYRIIHLLVDYREVSVVTPSKEMYWKIKTTLTGSSDVMVMMNQFRIRPALHLQEAKTGSQLSIYRSR